MQESKAKFTNNLFNGTKKYSDPEPLSPETLQYVLNWEPKPDPDYSLVSLNPILTWESVRDSLPNKPTDYSGRDINPDLSECLEYLRKLKTSEPHFNPDPNITRKCIECVRGFVSDYKEFLMDQDLKNELMDYFHKKNESLSDS